MKSMLSASIIFYSAFDVKDMISSKDSCHSIAVLCKPTLEEATNARGRIFVRTISKVDAIGEGCFLIDDCIVHCTTEGCVNVSDVFALDLGGGWVSIVFDGNLLLCSPSHYCDHLMVVIVVISLLFFSIVRGWGRVEVEEVEEETSRCLSRWGSYTKGSNAVGSNCRKQRCRKQHLRNVTIGSNIRGIKGSNIGGSI